MSDPEISDMEANLLNKEKPEPNFEEPVNDMQPTTDTNATDDSDPLKSVQKLTGKLGQKIREIGETIDPKDIKYILNSIISAMPLNKLDDTDKNDIVKKIKGQDLNEVGIDSPVDSTARFRASGGHTLSETEKIKLLSLIKKQ